MNRIYILLVLFICSGCDTKNDERIILTSGISMNPEEPRFGIEITNDKIYICQEKIEKKGTYNYYSDDLDSGVFENIKKDLIEKFNKDVRSGNIVDATPYQLDLEIRDKKRKIKFYFHYLNQGQMETINEIINLKGNNLKKFEKIMYHEFPMDLLNEKLPEPPPVPIER